ncbi:MAG: NADPH-dependent FMN reductase [Pseudobdellovibrionaceae bacterium]
MKYIISGTDRSNSNSLQVSNFILKLYQDIGVDAEVIDLAKVNLFSKGPQYGQKEMSSNLHESIQKIDKSEGLIIVCPEYNGSMPGVLKYFIDHWKYPESFEFRPICFVGLGGLFGGLRPVEHLQQVFGYRNSFIYPERIFLMNVWKILKDGEITDPLMKDLLLKQTNGFQAFCKALNQSKLDALSRRK